MDDEREQIEQLRAWWSDYGNYVIAGIVIGALALFGLSYYQSAETESSYAASAAWGELADAVVAEDVATAQARAQTLIDEDPDGAYAAQARLALARLYMDGNRDQDAAGALKELIDSDAPDAYRHVGRLRLARILLYQDKPAEVLDLLGEPGEDDGAFAARYDETRGDAYVALGRLDDAREAYRRALSEPAGDTTVDQSFVQLKLLDLPVVAVPEANEPASDLPEPPGDATSEGGADDAGDAPAEAPADAADDDAADDETGDAGE